MDIEHCSAERGGTMKVFAIFDERGAFVRAASNEQNAITSTPVGGERIPLTLVRDDAQKLSKAECKHGTLIRRDMSGWEFSTSRAEKPKSLNKQKSIDKGEDET